MINEIISYLEMCQRERASLQRGMNYRLGGERSVVLMSRRPNAPYRDRVEADGTTLIYEGHNEPRSEVYPDPKSVDQPGKTVSGSLTQNGKFYRAALQYKSGRSVAECVCVYEKIRQGIWSYNGLFRLTDAWLESDGQRSVYKFKLELTEENDDHLAGPAEFVRTRIIPSEVKLDVWKRDVGKCVICGAYDELHFDHIVPYSKGGTSLRADNIQLLCARHNLQKHDKIE